MQAKTLLTVDEFEKLEFPEDTRFELDEGELFEMTFPNFRHNRIGRRTFLVFHEFVETNGLGEVFLADAGFALSPNTLRGPDVSFIVKERLDQVDPSSSRFPGAPDLAVEVLSPNDRATDLQRRIRQFLSAGARFVMVLYPETEEIHVHEPEQNVRVFHGETHVTFSDLLPGFAVPAARFFE